MRLLGEVEQCRPGRVDNEVRTASRHVIRKDGGKVLGDAGRLAPGEDDKRVFAGRLVDRVECARHIVLLPHRPGHDEPELLP